MFVFFISLSPPSLMLTSGGIAKAIMGGHHCCNAKAVSYQRWPHVHCMAAYRHLGATLAWIKLKPHISMQARLVTLS
jgi:hypothetical protein